MARDITCDNDDGQAAVLLISNLGNGETQAVCGACLPVFALTLAAGLNPDVQFVDPDAPIDLVPAEPQAADHEPVGAPPEAVADTARQDEITPGADPGNYPAAAGEPVLDHHSHICEQVGHATHTVDGIDTGVCPRCGAVKD